MLTFDTENYDTDTMHSTSSNTGRLVATTAGKYIIEGQVEFAASATGVRVAQIRLNGTTIIASNRKLSLSTGVTQVGVDTVYNLAANDYVELLVNQSSLVALNADAGLGTTWFGATRQADDGAIGATGPTGATGASGASLPYTDTVYFMWPAPPTLLVTATQALSANFMYAVRCVCPKAGTLDGLYAWSNSGSGNYDVGVYSLSSGVITLAYSKGSTAMFSTGSWQKIATPSLAVTAGQIIYLAISLDTALTMFKATLSQNGTLHADFVGGSEQYMLVQKNSGGFPLPTPLTLSTLVASQQPLALMAHVT